MEDIKRVALDPNNVTYCVLATRLGVNPWLVELEYTKFKPGTDTNDKFHVFIIKWPKDLPMFTVVASFDKSEKEFAESLLEKNGLRKILPGNVMMVIGPEGTEKFPIEGPNVFYLENRSGSPMYTNDEKQIDAARAKEHEFCQKFFDEHDRWMQTPEGIKAGDEWDAKHPAGYCR